ncbi:MAG: 8-oxo-dGTP diphosphatase MutT [Gammaproteobacteria bacterium]|nr:8-oxo-dGTP diphosphatase MutT [Gammaproteobacteria bacterium]
MPRPAELSGQAPTSIRVIVGIVVDDTGRVLVQQRPPGKHMAGYWEFPGGKLESGETARQGLVRELREELGLGVLAAEPLMTHVHDYADRRVELDVWWVEAFEGSVEAREGQQLAWVAADRFDRVQLLPADAPIVAAVRAKLAG